MAWNGWKGKKTEMKNQKKEQKKQLETEKREVFLSEDFLKALKKVTTFRIKICNLTATPTRL